MLHSNQGIFSTSCGPELHEWASLVVQLVKNPAAMRETPGVQSRKAPRPDGCSILCIPSPAKKSFHSHSLTEL